MGGKEKHSGGTEKVRAILNSGQKRLCYTEDICTQTSRWGSGPWGSPRSKQPRVKAQLTRSPRPEHARWMQVEEHGRTLRSPSFPPPNPCSRKLSLVWRRGAPATVSTHLSIAQPFLEHTGYAGSGLPMKILAWAGPQTFVWPWSMVGALRTECREYLAANRLEQEGRGLPDL